MVRVPKINNPRDETERGGGGGGGDLQGWSMLCPVCAPRYLGILGRETETVTENIGCDPVGRKSYWYIPSLVFNFPDLAVRSPVGGGGGGRDCFLWVA